MHREKAKWKLSKNAMCCFEQILEVIPHKTADVWPLTPPPHLTSHPSKTNKTFKEKLVTDAYP